MRACAGVRQRDLGDAPGGRWLIEGAVGAEEAAVAVRGVLAEADVARDIEVGPERAYFADSGDDGAIRVIGGGAALVLWIARFDWRCREAGLWTDAPCCS